MTLRGERFVLNFSDDEDAGDDHDQQPQSSGFVSDFVADIKERTPSAPTPPSAPRLTSPTGFPAPRKRAAKSTFKRLREQAKQPSTSPTDTPPAPPSPPRTDKARFEPDEKRAIDEENRRRLASMSPAQIAKEREELMSSLPPSLLERFLRRATLDDQDEMNNQVLSPAPAGATDASPASSVKERKDDSPTTTKSVRFDVPTSDPQSTAQESPQEDDEEDESFPFEKEEKKGTTVNIDDLPPAQPPPDLFPASQPPTGSIHFPRPPPRTSPMPKLDPNSPSFLADLQEHYFPDIPQDVSSLSWLDPSQDDTPPTSAYRSQSTATAIAPAAIRFSLRGTILAPRTSLSLPTTLGLHHHGDDPEAAGYTIPELAIFSRSSLPAQRCLAWQVLGRLLYRLGKGEFGQRGDTLVEGLWSVIEREGVVARMLAEASGGSGVPDDDNSDAAAQLRAAGIGKHASARAWATEGIWLWRQGGGGDRGLLKEGQVRST
ncbi:hypothetical protein VTO42DRAFT_7054 [Malbranchea cinnamomea]